MPVKIRDELSRLRQPDRDGLQLHAATCLRLPLSFTSLEAFLSSR